MYSNGERAKTELGWTPRFTLEQMCKYDYKIDNSSHFCTLALTYPSLTSPLCNDVEHCRTLPPTGQNVFKMSKNAPLIP